MSNSLHLCFTYSRSNNSIINHNSPLQDDVPPEPRQLDLFKLTGPATLTKASKCVCLYYCINIHLSLSVCCLHVPDCSNLQNALQIGSLAKLHICLLHPLQHTLHTYIHTHTHRRTWWTVDACAPEPSPELDVQLERALFILNQLIGMKLLVVRLHFVSFALCLVLCDRCMC